MPPGMVYDGNLFRLGLGDFVFCQLSVLFSACHCELRAPLIYVARCFCLLALAPRRWRRGGACGMRRLASVHSMRIFVFRSVTFVFSHTRFRSRQYTVTLSVCMNFCRATACASILTTIAALGVTILLTARSKSQTLPALPVAIALGVMIYAWSRQCLFDYVVALGERALFV